ncbi:unnamed protein product [Lasius platythorax]|uniref:Secreted protein n=1 Tax=Lasius platythorax TaxID=488582 RepID=A0AAV2N561_9HYME
MMILKKVTVILIVFIWARDSLAGCHRSRRSNNEYILHRCTATAELIRKHRNGEGVSSRKTENDSSSRLQLQQRDPEIFAATILTDASQSETPSGVYRRMTHMRRRGSGHARRITGKHLADTPLRTLNIDAPQGRPSVFKRKNPLPELAHDVSGRKIDSSPRVVIIKPVT